MKTRNKQIAFVSASALASGFAHGAIVYTYANPSKPYNVCTINGPSLYLDLNHDGQADFNCYYNGGNANKPYISDTVGLSQSLYTPFVLSDAVDGSYSQGLPLTAYGTMIDSTYESAQQNGYFNQDSNGHSVGGWSASGTNIDGYVGLVLQDGAANNYYGWAHFVYNNTAPYAGVSGTLTLVDYAFETQPNTGITAGQTAEAGTAPAIVVGPSSQTGGVQESVQLTVVGTGNPAPTYQWKAGAVGSGVYTNLVDGGNISGSTSNVLTISALTSANGGDYVVELANNVSTTTSAPATLSIAPLAINSLTPSAADLLAGGRVSINVNYSSSAPVTSFQWLKNGTILNNGADISGATSSNLVITGASPLDAGNYSLVMANTYGMVTSAVDSVTVQSPSVPYDEAVTALNPVAYYRFNELADPASSNAVIFDSFGGFNGTYGYQTANGNPTNNAIAGPLPSLGFNGFSPTNTALGITNATAWTPSYTTMAPLNINTNTATFTAWIYPTVSEQAYTAIISYRAPVAGTASGIGYSPSAGLNTLGYHWNDTQSSWSYDSGLTIPQNQWSFVAVVISPTTSEFYVINANGTSYTNQTGVANAPAALNTQGQIGGDGISPNFIGNIDDVAIFNQSLSYQQVTNLYNVAVTGQFAATVVLNLQQSGSNLILNWNPPVGTLLQAPSVTGPWTTNPATPPYTFTPTQSQTYFRVVQ